MSHKHHTLIWDSTEPHNVPSGSLAIAYVGGSYAWPEDQIKRMGAVYRLCEQSSGAPSFMDHARGIGVEAGAASVEDAIQGCHNRHKHGFDDFTVYLSASKGSDNAHQPGMAGMIQALHSKAPGLPFRLHVADWDGNPDYVPEAEGVKAWAKQYLGNVHGGAYDLSVLFGVNDLVSK